MFVERDSELWKVLSEVVSDEGFQMYDLERVGGGGLRVTISAQQIDSKSESDQSSNGSTGNGSVGSSQGSASQGSVTSLDCSRICKRLLLFLAVEGPNIGVSSEPNLEVSSPGVNRNLRSIQHFEGAVGERVKVVCHSPTRASENKGASAQEVLGILENFVDQRLSIREESSKELVDLDFSNVKKARVDFHFGS